MASSLSNNKIYSRLTEGLRDTNILILAEGLDGYEESIKRWSEAAEKRAAAVVFPTCTEEVSKVVKVVRKHNMDFVVCCGRHSTSGASSIENGVVIDLSKINHIIIDEENKVLTFGGGCLWDAVDAEAGKRGLATVGGTINHTGVGGLILGGGMGWLTARHGLSIDLLLSATCVLGDGRIVIASAMENPDLFWALRGAGASFAIVTEFVMQAFEQKNNIWAGNMIFTPDKLPQLVEYANKHHEKANDEGYVFGFVCPPPTFTPMLMAVPFYNGQEAEAREFFADLYAIGPVVDMTRSMPYEEVNTLFNFAATHGERKSSNASAISPPFTLSLIQEIWDQYRTFIEENKDAGVQGSYVPLAVIPYKKLMEVPLEATAFGHRGAYYNAELLLRWNDPTLDQKARKFNRELNAKIRRIGVREDEKAVGAYSNNIEQQVDPRRVWGVNTKRVIELKKIYDPDNVFRKWHDVLYKEPSQKE